MTFPLLRTNANGKNISCDLHMEHLNRECHRRPGCNITDNAIQRVGRSLRSSIIENIDWINSINPSSGHHTVRSSEADTFDAVSKVFSYTPGRDVGTFQPSKATL